MSKFKVKIILLTVLLIIYLIFKNDINFIFFNFIDLIEYRFTSADSFDSRLGPIINISNNYNEWLYFGSGPMSDLKYSDIRIHNFFLSIFIQYGIINYFLMCIFILLIIIFFFKKLNLNNMYFFISFLLWCLGLFFNTVTYYKVLYIIPLICFIVIVLNNIKRNT